MYYEVKAPRDDPYSVRGQDTLASKHAMDDPILIRAWACFSHLPKEESAQDSITRRALQDEKNKLVDQLVHALQVFSLKRTVRYARGESRWHILQSES